MKRGIIKRLAVITTGLAALLLCSCTGTAASGRKNSGVSAAGSSSSETPSSRVESSSAVSKTASDQKTNVSKPQADESSSSKPGRQHIICIDPGHQKLVDTGTEPIAPGSSVMKIKNPGGATGVSSHTPEYVINLIVSKKIQALLLSDGYKVVMTREDNDCNISNIGRAKVANAANADIFLRIHADSVDDEEVSGASVLIPKAGYLTDEKLITESKVIGNFILDGLVGSTGARSRGLSPRDDMTGFNWSKVPVVLVEMGFLSNPREDGLLNTDAYQNKIAQGIVNGINRYFEQKDDGK